MDQDQEGEDTFAGELSEQKCTLDCGRNVGDNLMKTAFISIRQQAVVAGML